MRKTLLRIALFTLIAAPLIGYSADNIPAENQPVVKTEKKPLYWVDPMEPDVHYTAPGKSRMGMELVPVYSEKKNK